MGEMGFAARQKITSFYPPPFALKEAEGKTKMNQQIQKLSSELETSQAEWHFMMEELNKPLEPFYRRRLGFLDRIK